MDQINLIIINYDAILTWQGIEESFKKHEYNLYGVSNHSGTTVGGHYTATIKCLTDKKWYDISDSNINICYSESKPISHSKSATILAYAKNQEYY